MAFGRKSGGRENAPTGRTAPAPRPQQQYQSRPSSDEGRFERGLERRWEAAWNRARSGGR